MAVSSGLVVLALLNVPLSTAVLSNGLLVLLLLWVVAPDKTAAIDGRVGDQVELHSERTPEMARIFGTPALVATAGETSGQ